MRWPRVRHGATWAIPAALAIDAVGTGRCLPLSMVCFLAVTDLSEADVGLLLTAATAWGGRLWAAWCAAAAMAVLLPPGPPLVGWSWAAWR